MGGAAGLALHTFTSETPLPIIWYDYTRSHAYSIHSFIYFVCVCDTRYLACGAGRLALIASWGTPKQPYYDDIWVHARHNRPQRLRVKSYDKNLNELLLR